MRRVLGTGLIGRDLMRDLKVPPHPQPATVPRCRLSMGWRGYKGRQRSVQQQLAVCPYSSGWLWAAEPHLATAGNLT